MKAAFKFVEALLVAALQGFEIGAVFYTMWKLVGVIP